MASDYLYPEGKLICFTKAPGVGEVKTRLIPRLGANGAADLQRALVKLTVETACSSQLAPVSLWCSPDTRHAMFEELKSQHGVPLKSQQGIGLGSRMHHALAAELHGAKYAVLMGCDCPVVTAGYLQLAFHSLAKGCDAVLGPVSDGGYFLVGVRRADPAIFADIEWSRPDVFEESVARIEQLGWRWSRLETLWDVDRPNDLDRLQQEGLFIELGGT